MIAFLIILAALLIQTQLLPILGLKLDLLVLITIYFGLLYGWKRGLIVGLVSGLFQDVFSGGMLGLAPIGLAACGILAGYSRQMLLLRYWVVRISLVFVLTALNLGIYLVMLTFFYQKSFLQLFNSQWLLISLGNTIVAAVLFWLVDRYG